MAQVVQTAVKQWGNGLAVRLSRPVARAAGFSDGSPVKITAEPGRLVIELAVRRMSLKERPERFDPARHCGEAMALSSAGREIL